MQPLDETITSVELAGGIVLKYPEHLDGGGNFFKQFFVKIIKQHGKLTYKNGFEWCAGHGIIGFELLSLGICNTIAFSDKYPRSIESCLYNATENNITDKVHGYVSSTIKDIPTGELWDLVVSNPPHAWNWDHTQDDTDENTYRILVDHHMETHTEFFLNIKERLSKDADLFILEHDQSVRDKYISMAEAGGLVFLNSYVVDSQAAGLNPGHEIYHFKLA